MIALDTTSLWIGFVVGVPASALFFVGLALGMRMALASERPAIWLLVSFFGRTAVLLGAGYLLTTYTHPLWSIIGYILAFLLIRIVTVKWVKSAKNINLTNHGGA